MGPLSRMSWGKFGANNRVVVSRLLLSRRVISSIQRVEWNSVNRYQYSCLRTKLVTALTGIITAPGNAAVIAEGCIARIFSLVAMEVSSGMTSLRKRSCRVSSAGLFPGAIRISSVLKKMILLSVMMNQKFCTFLNNQWPVKTRVMERIGSRGLSAGEERPAGESIQNIIRVR